MDCPMPISSVSLHILCRTSHLGKEQSFTLVWTSKGTQGSAVCARIPAGRTAATGVTAFAAINPRQVIVESRELKAKAERHRRTTKQTKALGTAAAEHAASRLRVEGETRRPRSGCRQRGPLPTPTATAAAHPSWPLQGHLAARVGCCRRLFSALKTAGESQYKQPRGAPVEEGARWKSEPLFTWWYQKHAFETNHKVERLNRISLLFGYVYSELMGSYFELISKPNKYGTDQDSKIHCTQFS